MDGQSHPQFGIWILIFDIDTCPCCRYPWDLGSQNPYDRWGAGYDIY
jgi:hypothetical protein